MQFRGLCDEAIAYMSAKAAGDVVDGFVTLPSDLDGFWAMVLLQVDDCDSMIRSVEALRANAWQSPPSAVTPTVIPLAFDKLSEAT